MRFDYNDISHYKDIVFSVYTLHSECTIQQEYFTKETFQTGGGKIQLIIVDPRPPPTYGYRTNISLAGMIV